MQQWVPRAAGRPPACDGGWQAYVERRAPPAGPPRGGGGVERGNPAGAPVYEDTSRPSPQEEIVGARQGAEMQVGRRRAWPPRAPAGGRGCADGGIAGERGRGGVRRGAGLASPHRFIVSSLCCALRHARIVKRRRVSGPAQGGDVGARCLPVVLQRVGQGGGRRGHRGAPPSPPPPPPPPTSVVPP